MNTIFERGVSMACTMCKKCRKHCIWCEYNKDGNGCYLEFTTADAKTCDRYIPTMGEGDCLIELLLEAVNDINPELHQEISDEMKNEYQKEG